MKYRINFFTAGPVDRPLVILRVKHVKSAEPYRVPPGSCDSPRAVPRDENAGHVDGRDRPSGGRTHSLEAARDEVRLEISDAGSRDVHVLGGSTRPGGISIRYSSRYQQYLPPYGRARSS